MRWAAVARKDFLDARRSRILWGVTAVFAALVSVIVLSNDPTGSESVSLAMSTMVGVGTFVLPLAVIVMTYLSITGERETGRIRYLLSLPLGRAEVLFGKFVGRSAVATLAVFVAFVGGGVTILVHTGDIPLGEYALLTLLTGWYVLVWTSISVGISAAVDSRGKALAGTLGTYFVFVLLYVMPVGDPQRSVEFLVENLLGLSPVPVLYDVILVVSPAYAYSLLGQVHVRGIEFTGEDYVGSYGDELPIYLSEWSAPVVLLCWFILPILVGYYRFRGAEIG